MFKSLATLSKHASLEAGYYLIRLLRYKNVLTQFNREHIITKGLAQNPSPETMQSIDNLVKEIEAAEGGRIEYLPDSTIEEYIKQISNIIQKRSIENLDYNAEEGKELLQKLRTERPIHS